MTDILITMNPSGTFSFDGDCGRVEEYCAKRLKIKLNTTFMTSPINYFTLSFEPYSLSRKIITENIYVGSDKTDGIYYSNGYIYCPIYDYIAVSPNVMVQVDGYETDPEGNVLSIIKSGIFTLEFGESLTGEGIMVETTRPDVKFEESVKNIVNNTLSNYIFDGENLKRLSVAGNKIKVLTITTSHLQDYSVTSTKIANNAVVTDNISDYGVTTPKIADGAVTEKKLADNSVTTSKVADKNITSTKIADGAVTGSKLAYYSVGDSKLRPNAVITSKIADGSVTPAKLDRTYITHHQSLAGYATQEWISKQNYVTDISMKADRSELPTKLSQLTNDMAVSYNSQKLTDKQKAIALQNIGAIKAESGKGLSSNDFTDEDKEKLNMALTEHQDISMKADRSELPSKLSELENDLDLPTNLSDFENDTAVSFSSVQTLTDGQKNIALENIGAVKAEADKTLSSNDFTDEDKEKLSNALTEHQDISMKADKSELSEVSFSGEYGDLKNLPDLEEIKNRFTEEMKAHYDASYEHSLKEHAPADAEENVIETIIFNGNETEVYEKQVALTTLEHTVYEPVFVEV